VSQREGFSIDFGIPKIEDETVRVIQEHQRNLTDTHLEEAWTALEQAQYSSSRDATRQKKKKFDDRPICFVRGLFTYLFIYLKITFFVFSSHQFFFLKKHTFRTIICFS